MTGKRKSWTNVPKGVAPTENGEWRVLVVPVAERVVYGRLEYQMTPVGGWGKSWIQDRRVEWIERPAYDVDDVD